MFSTKRYDRESFAAANERHGHELAYLEPRLTPETAPLARGYPAVCAFVNDVLSAEVLRTLADTRASSRRRPCTPSPRRRSRP